MSKKLLIKKSFFPRKAIGTRNCWILRAGNKELGVGGYILNEDLIRFCYEIGGKAAWFYPNDLPMYSKNAVKLRLYFHDWQRPTLEEDALFEIETGYSLQRIFNITIPEGY